MTAAEYAACGTLERRILFLFAFWPETLGPDVLVRLLRDADGTSPKLRAVGLFISHLAKHEIIQNTANGRDAWMLGSPLPRDVLAAMLDEADRFGWWPDGEREHGSGGFDFFPELNRPRFATSFGKPSLARLEMEGVRLVFEGCGATASKDLRAALKEKKAKLCARAIAHTALLRQEGHADWHLMPGDPLIEVFPCLLQHAFISGMADLESLLAEIHRLLEEGANLSEDVMRAYWTACVWSGHAEGIKAYATTSAVEMFLNGCEAAVRGDFAMADVRFKIDDEDLCDEGGGHPPSGYDNFPERLLKATVAALVKMPKIAKQRPRTLLTPTPDMYNAHFRESGATRQYMRESAEVSNWVSTHWYHVLSGRGELLKAYNEVRVFTPPVCLMLGWDYFCKVGVRAPVRNTAIRAWKAAVRFAEQGWPTFGRLAAALFAGAYDDQANAEVLRTFEEKGIALLARREQSPDWKLALQQFANALPKISAKKPKRETMPKRRLYWCLLADDANETTEIFENISLRATLNAADPPKAGEKQEFYDYDSDVFLSEYDLEKKAVRELMTQTDLQVLGAMSSGGYYRTSTARVHDALSVLCGCDNVAFSRATEMRWSMGYTQPIPITLERRTCEMSSVVRSDGGVILSVPDWAMECSKGWCVRRLDENRFAYIEIDDKAKKLIECFRACCTDGKIEIPREGMAEATHVIEAMTSILPIEEPSTEEAEKLPRVSAAHDVRVRLDFTGGALSVHAVVVPQPENPNLFLDPGYGPLEKVVVGVATSYVLVRDLEAEKAAFEPIRAAMAEDETAFDGKSAWLLDDLASAIAALTRLKALGEKVPLEWINLNRLNVSSAPKSGVTMKSTRTADDWFRVEGEFKLDDGRVLNVVKMLEAARNRVGNYVKLSDGDYVALSKSMARELDALNAAGRRKGEGVEIVKAAIPMLDNAFAGGDDALELPDAMAVTAKEIRSAFAKRPSVPKTLHAELRPYQEDGYRWLSRLAACGFGSCLADDMGLGKTIQVISLLLDRAKGGASLVVAPSSVCGNWRRELQRFAPTLNPLMAMEEGVVLATAKAFDVMIVSYGYLLFHADEFAAVVWNGLVLDEAQAIKNDASKRARTVKSLHAKFRVAATGTPVENRLGELWSLFDFLNPGLLGPAASFASRFTVDGKAVPELKRLVKPLILRRLKGDVLDDLPDKTEVTIPVVLGNEERSAYEGCRVHALAQLQAKAEEGGEANRMSILAELTRLRRFCCHPSLVLPGQNVPSAKMEALVELLDGLHEGHHRALVFSQFTDYLAIVRNVITTHGWTHLYLDGATPTLEREKFVNDFQSGEGDFFLISLKAGGTGLNLTAANYVILLDPWWNPAVENQAADRAHRIGQKNPVTVYRLIASDTVEARVIELHKEKQAIAEDVLDGTSSTSLSPAQLMRLFS